MAAVRPDEGECLAIGGRGFHKSRPPQSRRSPRLSNDTAESENSWTQFHGNNPSSLLASSLTTTTTKTNQFPTPRLSSSLAESQFPVQRLQLVDENKGQKSLLGKSLNTSSPVIRQRQQVSSNDGLETFEVTSGRSPTYSHNPGRDEKKLPTIFVDHSRPKAKRIPNEENNSTAHNLTPPELTAVGRFGLSPRMQTKALPTLEQPTPSDGEWKSMDRLPSLAECLSNKYPAQLTSSHRQQRTKRASNRTRGIVGESRQFLSVTSSTDDSLDAGLPRRNVSVTTCSTDDAASVGHSSAAAAAGKSGSSVGSLDTPDMVENIERFDDNEDEPSSTVLPLSSDELRNEETNKDNDLCDVEYRMPILSVRIEITGSNQRRTVVATSDAASTGCDVIEKHLPSSKRKACCAAMTAAEGESRKVFGPDGGTGEHYLSVAGRGRMIAVDSRSYNNFARQQNSHPRVGANAGSSSTANGYGSISVSKLVGQKQGSYKSMNSKQ